MAGGKSWSLLTNDLLWRIIKLLGVADYVRFGAVCVSWRQAMSETRCLPAQNPTLPWLILPAPNNASNFLSVVENRSCQILLPEITDERKKCIGSSNNWLFFVDEICELYMLDPLSRVQYTLPSITTLPGISNVSRNMDGEICGYHIQEAEETSDLEFMRRNYFVKAVCTKPRSNPRDMLVAIICTFSEKIAVTKVGDKSWTTFDSLYMCDIFDDILFHKNQLYALSTSGQIFMCHLSDDLPRSKKMTIVAPGPTDRCTKRYLAESSDGRLIQVCRLITWMSSYVEIFLMKDFGHYKIGDNKDHRLYWDRANCLGDYSLFLGYNHAIMISTSSLPDMSSCVFITDNRHADNNCFIGVYYLKSYKFVHWFKDVYKCSHPPVWFS